MRVWFSDDPVPKEVKHGNNKYKHTWLHAQVDEIFQKQLTFSRKVNQDNIKKIYVYQ